MLQYDEPIVGAKRAAKYLADEIRGDLDDAVGGISWWVTDDLAPDVHALLSHYTVSVVRGVAANLDEAAFHCFQYQGCVRKEDYYLSSQVRKANGGIPNLAARQGVDSRRQTEIGAEQAAFFRSIGSVLDTLAAMVIAVGALELDLLRADFGTLRTFDTSDSYPRLSGQAARTLRQSLAEEGTPAAEAQESLLRSLRAAVVHAGPPGWAQWTLDTRNNFVHRPRWMNLLVHYRPHRNDPITWVRPLPRTPTEGEGAALRAASELADTHLTEDALDSMRGVLSSVDALTTAVVEQCSQLWRKRRASPDLLTQPPSQWKPRTVNSFDGYSPGTAQKAFDSAGVVVVNPSDGARLTALMDMTWPKGRRP
ncbi:hypothetical protein [Rhodococcus opacus]|uniref:hypothetical protein n=1 Tax=Rhodococcus opacus TaxID=37919 RepID=UPI002948E588|nr:hypothetical protein [Rhodococcus opacus]MDV6247048.1 hypothetical protein [Rhodococcus opacus]